MTTRRATPAGTAAATSSAAAPSCRWTRRSANFARATCWSRARRSSPSGRTCNAGDADGDRRARPHRHAGLHRHPPPPVRDGAAQLPRRRHPDQRRLGHAERGSDLLRIHPAQVRARVPAAGRLHQRAVRRPGAARRRRHDGARRLADPSLARSTPTPPSRRCSIRGAAPRSAISRAPAASPIPATSIRSDAIRIKQQWFSSSDQLVHMIMGGEVYLGEPTYTQAWKIGRQLGLQIAAHILSPFGIRPILDDLAAGHGRRQQQHRARPRQPVHPHDRHVRPGLAEGQGRRARRSRSRSRSR